MSRDLLNIYTEYLFAPRLSENHARFVLFARMLGAVIVLNVLDGLLTLIWVYTHQAVELNPLMSLLIDTHPVLFITLKIALVNLGSIILLRNCDKSLAQLAAIMTFFLYTGLIIYHSSAVILQVS